MNRASSPSLVFEVGDDTVQIRCSTMADGDFHLDGHRAALLHRRAAFAPGVWTQLDEVHGTAVVRVTHPGEHDFATGDAAITDRRNAVLAAWVGDCAPVALVGDDGTIAVVHAGWRGALAGVLQATVSQMSSGTVVAVLGHCIHPCCYEFGEPDRAPFRARFGAHVEARTSWGAPALDMPSVVRCALEEVGVAVVDASSCTGCDVEHLYSHRRRRQLGRQVMTVCKRASR
ncbi:MAG: polyphenol oxidase family protein [Ilumatobacteraceae bacterium]